VGCLHGFAIVLTLFSFLGSVLSGVFLILVNPEWLNWWCLYGGLSLLLGLALLVVLIGIVRRRPWAYKLGIVASLSGLVLVYMQDLQLDKQEMGYVAYGSCLLAYWLAVRASHDKKQTEGVSGDASIELV
jgi:hypothetical protein